MTSPASPPAVRQQRRRPALDIAVADRVRVLQKLSLEDVPSAVRALAVLRRAAGTEPGASPDAWADTIGLLPDALLGRGDEPSASELAVHHAMTLFALHRQGRVKWAHVDGVEPGAAFASVARKRSGGDEDEGVRRRFDALITATTTAEAAHHLRGLILLSRSEEVGLDYGHLATDLADLWTPRNRDRVRLRWARSYRSSRADEAQETPDPSEPTAQERP